ncbi:hypothetical protein MPLDJ20_80229 [Mesorhizobium plurifarium]|uniref:Methyltransferase domain-containing protein n=1 Tax=Mesorhizobium plurifarium TaxID=69974 RepID=A0A090GRL3_MESPL|nr:hypothetical protein MPLDJ20_80229 [Mesorhizobium plurifarium]
MTHRLFDVGQFFRGPNWNFDINALNGSSSEKYASFYAAMVRDGLSDYDLDRITTAIFYLRSILVRHGMTGRHRTAVEIGCGTGNKSLSINDLFGQYVGIDLLADQINEARQRSHSLNQNNVEFIAENAVRVLNNFNAFGLPSKIDLLILYAVLEHLTPNERMDVLSLADDVIQSGGHVLIMESPNRLLPFDSHTTGSHFFNWLPDRMAFDFAKSETKRSELVQGFGEWTGERSRESLYRIGRGVSFHDLEQALTSDLSNYSFPMHSFCCETLNMEPLQNQEVNLLGYLTKNLPEKPGASFARAWIDTLVGGPASKTYDVQYLSPFWPLWSVQEAPPDFWHSPSALLSSQRDCWEAEPGTREVSEIVLCFTGDAATISVEIDSSTSDQFGLADLVRARPKRWHNSFSVAYRLDRRVGRIRIRCLSGSVHFNGAFLSTERQRPGRQPLLGLQT